MLETQIADMMVDQLDVYSAGPTVDLLVGHLAELLVVPTKLL